MNVSHRSNHLDDLLLRSMDSESYLPPSKRRKRQQRKACDLCRRRKVRCDIDEQPGNSCSVCERSQLECRSTTQWARPNRRPSHVRPLAQLSPEATTNPRQGRSHSVEDISSFDVEKTQPVQLPNSRDNPITAGPATSSPCSASSLLSQPSTQKEDFARSGLSRFFKHGINAAAWGVFDSMNHLRIAYVGTPVSNLVHLVQLHRATRCPPAVGAMASIDNAALEDISIHSDSEVASKVVHYPYPPIRPKNGWKPGPEVWQGMTTQDLTSDVSSFPAQEVRDSLIAAYFEHVHPFHPVISMPEFMASYRSQDKPPPLLLFQAVLMAGAHACSHPLVTSARHAVKTTLFRRASMLFHMRHETDRAFLMQAAVLFTRHIGDGDTVTGGPWYWSGIAIRIGVGLGMHRQSPTLPALEISQYRRCWWSAFVCEVFASLETGRPCGIRAEDMDQLILSPDDMVDTPGKAAPSNFLRPDFIIHMVELAYIGLDIIALNEPAQQRIIDLQSINTRLCQWSLQSGITSSSDDEDPWTCQLQMHYNLLLLHLHRNFPVEPTSQSVSSSSAETIIRTLEKLTSLNCLAQCHFTAVSAVTAAGIQLANEVRTAVATQAFLIAINALEHLARLLKPAQALSAYWPSAEAVHKVFQEIYHEYKTYVSQGLHGEPVLVSDVQPDWYRLLAGTQPQPVIPAARDWLNIGTDWTGLL